MPRLLPRRRTLMALAVAVLLVSAIAPVRWTRWVTSKARGGLTTVLTPATHPLKTVADAVRRPSEEGTDLEDESLRQRYEQMLIYARQLEQRLAEARERIANLSRVRDRLDLTGTTLAPASVTAWRGRRGTSSLTIDRGGRDGVRVGQAVADRAYLVGRITDTDPVSATVRLINAPETALTVRIVPATAGAAPRQAYVRIGIDEGGRAFTARVGVDEPVREGDLVHLADKLWPAESQGFIVGRVTAVDRWPDDPLLYRRITVTPPISLTHLRRVVVLVPAEAD